MRERLEPERSYGQVGVLTDVESRLAEGPVWDDKCSTLYWVDIPAGVVHAYETSSGNHRRYAAGCALGAVALTTGPMLALAASNGFAFLDLETGRVDPIVAVEDDKPENRMNDGACDRVGRFWAGTMALDERRGAGSLYRLDRGFATPVLSSVSISNGIGWDPDDQVMYYVDSGTGRVDVFDFDVLTGVVANRRPFVDVPAALGIPDGLTVDADGNVWVAIWGGSAVQKYSPDGVLMRAIETPVSLVTSCAFGGNDLQTLYITTARGRDSDGLGGSVFWCRPGAEGKPNYRYISD